MLCELAELCEAALAVVLDTTIVEIAELVDE
jgi:hypothetical protein